MFIGPITPETREDGMMHLNHSCNPNVGFRGEITFVALRDIKAGEETSFDYATGDHDDWQMACRCGADHCRGIITGFDWKRPELQRKYRGYFAAYLQAMIAFVFEIILPEQLHSLLP